MNFQDETYKAIADSGHHRSDVMFIGTQDGKYRLNMDQFDRLSNFEYDNSWGFTEIRSDLIIFFKDKSCAVRCDYDGSEWWSFLPLLDYKEDDEFQLLTRLKEQN